MADHKITRRKFVQSAATSALSVAALGAFVSACKSESGADSSEGGGGTEESEGSGALDCSDVSGLTDAEKKTREQLKYVEQSTEPGKNCANCQLYQAPEGGAGCGGCTVVKGPINPAGYCTSWVKKSA